MPTTDTKSKIKAIGRALLQTHGYNGFSFKDIADKIKIRKASVFEHFESKEALVVAIIEAYGDDFDLWKAEIEVLDPLAQIRKAFDVFYHFSSDREKVCPVLALTIDTKSISPKVLRALNEFLKKWMDWLENKITLGQGQGLIRGDLDSKVLCKLIYGIGMGSQLEARVFKEPDLPIRVANMVVALLRGHAR